MLLPKLRKEPRRKLKLEGKTVIFSLSRVSKES